MLFVLKQGASYDAHHFTLELIGFLGYFGLVIYQLIIICQHKDPCFTMWPLLSSSTDDFRRCSICLQLVKFTSILLHGGIGQVSEHNSRGCDNHQRVQ